MAKKTRKEIEETLRNKLANKHNDYVERQQKKYGELWDAYCRARKECDKYQEENEELKEKIRRRRLKRCEQTKKSKPTSLKVLFSKLLGLGFMTFN